jgi:hypothetical protein
MQKKPKEMSKKQLNIGTHHWGQRARIRRAHGGMPVMVGSVTHLGRYDIHQHRALMCLGLGTRLI